MSIAETAGATALDGGGWSASVLSGPPLIAPARQFTFPQAVAGEEDALARGALWVQVRSAGGAWLAQCALGFAGGGVAHGLWPLPDPDCFLACAGGYAYVLSVQEPARAVLLPARPAVGVLTLPEHTVLTMHHGLLVRDAAGETWATERLSWEGVRVTGVEGDRVHGLGWNLPDDVEVPFAVDLRLRTASGGGFTGR